MGKYPFVASVAAVVVVLDQATKWYIDHTVQVHQSIPVIDSFFHITYSRNTGGAACGVVTNDSTAWATAGASEHRRWATRVAPASRK